MKLISHEPRFGFNLRLNAKDVGEAHSQLLAYTYESKQPAALFEKEEPGTGQHLFFLAAGAPSIVGELVKRDWSNVDVYLPNNKTERQKSVLQGASLDASNTELLQDDIDETRFFGDERLNLLQTVQRILKGELDKIPANDLVSVFGPKPVKFPFAEDIEEIAAKHADGIGEIPLPYAGAMNFETDSH